MKFSKNFSVFLIKTKNCSFFHFQIWIGFKYNLKYNLYNNLNKSEYKMVDKSKNKQVVVKPVSKPKESKTELFIRLATKRVGSVLKSLRILGNCSNRSNYEYTSEQVEAMFNTIQIALNNTETKYTPSKKEQESFNF